MLGLGILPDSPKITKVLPLYKKVLDINSSHCRPISLLPSMSKIFEKLFLEQISTYSDNNNLIHKHHYGFRKHLSTEYATLHIVDYLNYEMDLKRTPINLDSDLSKVLDRLSITLSDPGSSESSLENYCIHIIHVHLFRCLKDVPNRIFSKFANLIMLQRFQNKK